jgi:hypothetical protein
MAKIAKNIIFTIVYGVSCCALGCAGNQGSDPEPAPATDSTVRELQALVGVYALRTEVSTIDKTPAGETRGRTFSYGWAELQWQNDGLLWNEDFCHIEMTSDSTI